MSVADELRKLRELLTSSRREAIHARATPGEVPDPIPLEMPIGYGGPPSMREMVHEYVRGALSEHAAEQHLGTFEEEDDFEADDPTLLDLSGYEVTEYEMVEEDPTGEVVPAEDPPSRESEKVEVAPEKEPVKPAAE